MITEYDWLPTSRAALALGRSADTPKTQKRFSRRIFGAWLSLLLRRYTK